MLSADKTKTVIDGPQGAVNQTISTAQAARLRSRSFPCAANGLSTPRLGLNS